MKMEQELKKMKKWHSNTINRVLINKIHMDKIVQGIAIKMEQELKKNIEMAFKNFKLSAD